MKPSLSRRDFLKAGAGFLIASKSADSLSVVTVNGRIPASSMGTTLVHEHLLVDFIGADKYNMNRWDRDDVVKKVLPHLREARKLGVKTIFDCTPAFLGRDTVLLRRLCHESGLQIITNTGYYGAVKNKYLPEWAYHETHEQMAERWISEFKHGIDGTGIRPGFIKISVDPGPLSALHQNLVKAAALTHLQTGLTICSHTGIAIPAFEQIDLLMKMNVHPSAFVWTHAQAEKDEKNYIKAASLGSWVSLDGIGWENPERYADSVRHLKSAGLLNKVLISHDAGWYKPGEKDGGTFTGFTKISRAFIPLLKAKGLIDIDIGQLLIKNPAEAYALRVRRY